VPVLAAAGAATAMGGLGALVTDLGPWYFSLREPAWKPPDWAFGPVWTLIFSLSAIAGLMAWRRDTARRPLILSLFALNGFFNLLWSILFFDLKRPDWALVEVGFLWLSILALIVRLAPISRIASLMLAPYLIWVTIAAALNLSVVRLNGPF
jgi:tryptophan-rich sensory protein